MDTNILQSEQVKKALVATLFLLCVFLGAKTISEFLKYDSLDNEIPYNVITVTGKGEAFAVADIANFSFSIDEEAPTLPEAQKKATEKGNKTLAYLKENGVDEKDIKTLSYNAGPKYEYTCSPKIAYGCVNGKNVIVGYTISNRVGVKVRNVEKAGELLTGIGERGAANMSELQFVVDDEEVLKAEARKLAIEDAKEKAEILAKDLGVDLDDITSFYENTNDYPMYSARSDTMMEKNMVGGAMANPIPQLPKGENKVMVSVSVTYKIK